MSDMTKTMLNKYNDRVKEEMVLKQSIMISSKRFCLEEMYYLLIRNTISTFVSTGLQLLLMSLMLLTTGLLIIGYYNVSETKSTDCIDLSINCTDYLDSLGKLKTSLREFKFLVTFSFLMILLTIIFTLFSFTIGIKSFYKEYQNSK